MFVGSTQYYKIHLHINILKQFLSIQFLTPISIAYSQSHSNDSYTTNFVLLRKSTKQFDISIMLFNK